MTTPAARVMVDGRAMGPTPLRMSLTPGKYRVVLLELDGIAELQKRTVTIKAGETTRLTIQLPDKATSTATASPVTNKVVIEVPAKVQVSVDGKVLGLGARVLDVPVGEHTIDVSMVMPDGRTWTKSMRTRVVAGAPLVLQFTPPDE